MERLREVLAFVNHKGGVGKTTTVQSLATGLRRYGKGYFDKCEVTIVPCDFKIFNKEEAQIFIDKLQSIVDQIGE